MLILIKTEYSGFYLSMTHLKRSLDKNYKVMNDEIYSEVFDEGLFLHSSTLCVEKFTNWKTLVGNDVDNFFCPIY